MNGGWDEQFLAPLLLIPLIQGMNSKSQEKRVIYNTQLTLVMQEFPIGREDMFGWGVFIFHLPPTVSPGGGGYFILLTALGQTKVQNC